MECGEGGVGGVGWGGGGGGAYVAVVVGAGLGEEDPSLEELFAQFFDVLVDLVLVVHRR